MAQQNVCYLSGAVIEAYLALNDMKPQPYQIVKPTRYAYRRSIWAIGEPVKL